MVSQDRFVCEAVAAGGMGETYGDCVVECDGLEEDWSVWVDRAHFVG